MAIHRWCYDKWCNFYGDCQRGANCFNKYVPKTITIMFNNYITAYHVATGKTFYMWLEYLPTDAHIGIIDALHDANFKVGKCTKQTYDAQVAGRNGDPQCLVYNPFGTYFHTKDADALKILIDHINIELNLEYIDVLTERGFIQTYVERGDSVSMIITRCLEMDKKLRDHSWFLYKEGEEEPLKAVELASRVIKTGMLLELRRA